jgi:hypothetical protein
MNEIKIVNCPGLIAAISYITTNALMHELKIIGAMNLKCVCAKVFSYQTPSKN